MSDKAEVVDLLISGFQATDWSSVTKFAHGKHDFQIRCDDGKVFRVAVEEWDEERQQAVLPDG
jgi:hypothetical protein